MIVLSADPATVGRRARVTLLIGVAWSAQLEVDQDSAASRRGGRPIPACSERARHWECPFSQDVFAPRLLAPAGVGLRGLVGPSRTWRRMPVPGAEQAVDRALHGAGTAIQYVRMDLGGRRRGAPGTPGRPRRARSGWRWTGQGPEALQRRLRPPGPADSTAGARRAAKGDTQTTDRPSLIRRPVCDRPAHSQRGERSHGRWWAVSPPRWSSPLLGGNRSAVRRIFFGPAPLVVLPTIGPTRLGGTMPKKTTKPAFGGSAISFEGCTDTLESLYGSAPIGPSEMTKKIWTYVKRRGLAKKH